MIRNLLILKIFDLKKFELGKSLTKSVEMQVLGVKIL